jgi:nicotinamidase-related amidase
MSWTCGTQHRLQVSDSIDALLVIDMQESLLQGDTKFDLPCVVERINRLATRVRTRGGFVVFVQHDGPPGDNFVPFTSGWEILSSIAVEPHDLKIRKTQNDAFFQTSLDAELKRRGVRNVLVSGWATDLCVDATVRSAAAVGYRVIVASDCHTVSNRPHLSAEGIREHHHWVWKNLISSHAVLIHKEADI